MEDEGLADAAPLRRKVTEVQHHDEGDEESDGDRGVDHGGYEGHDEGAEHAEQGCLPAEVLEGGPEVGRAGQVHRENG